MPKKIFLPFEEARAFVHTLKLKSEKDWRNWYKTNKPNNLPSNPYKYYSKEYIDIKDWLNLTTRKGVRFVSYEEASQYGIENNIKNRLEWEKHCKEYSPNKIPTSPHKMYSEFISWDLFLKTGIVKHEIKGVLSFEAAREYVRSLKLNKREQWYDWYDLNLPTNIPKYANKYYSKDWIGWENFIKFEIYYLSFEEAREYVRSLGLKNCIEWNNWIRNNKNKGIPQNPKKHYSKFISYLDWLGLKNGFTKTEFLPFEEAREYVRSLGLKTTIDWIEYKKSKNKLPGIPSNPATIYKGYGWRGVIDFINGEKESSHKREYLSFEEAKEYIKILGINSISGWFRWHKENKITFLPYHPERTYLKNGWKDFSDFLNCEIRVITKDFLPFEEARAFIRSLGLKSQNDLKKWLKNNRNTEHKIPTDPNVVYFDKGWIDYYDWLGTEENRQEPFLPFEEARAFVRTLGLNGQLEWNKACKEGKIPMNIPSSPRYSYPNQYIDLYDWLGTDPKLYRGELKINNFLEKIGIPFNDQHPFEDCKNIRPLLFDFYIESLNLVAEYDGEGHYEPIEFFGGEEKFKQQQINDQIKNKYCEDNNINMLRIAYWDYMNIEQLIAEKIEELTLKLFNTKITIKY